MGRVLKALAVVGALFAIGIVAALLFVNAPNEFVPTEAPVSAESRERNTVIATALAVGGLDDAFVDVTPERALVVFDLPELGEPTNGTREPDGFLQEFALGAAARGAPSSERLVVVQRVEGEPRLTWEVETRHVTAFLAGEIDEETLLAAITVT